uniref:E3 ubiquitin-protein ligase RNF144B-like n=1 Tax=Erigeron canadensis TaxID=72917 RepID=UPI001CB98DF3|nr:E3 ubiquitin-protein ligase RNF144B-like [Erigeron canadensis]
MEKQEERYRRCGSSVEQCLFYALMILLAVFIYFPRWIENLLSYCLTKCLDNIIVLLYAAVGRIAPALALVSSKYATGLKLYRATVGHKDDAEYAEELQVIEALLLPYLSSEKRSTTASVTCGICFEEQDYSQMFKNSTCSHSFCKDCTSKHATTKIYERNNAVTCPGLNCKSTLDNDKLKLILPKETLIKWDDFQCESSIPEWQKLYCPFGDCSVLLINDDYRISKIDCPVCKRSMCAVCRVPWHSEFSCWEFGTLRMTGEEDDMAVALAEKKKWKQCPNCNFFVEKAEGCVHIYNLQV